jgi:hypothetical protein
LPALTAARPWPRLKGRAKESSGKGKAPSKSVAAALTADTAPAGKPSSLLDTRVVYCGDCLEQLRKLPDACVDRHVSGKLILYKRNAIEANNQVCGFIFTLKK